MKTIEQTRTILDLPVMNNACSDYDEDCVFTQDEAFHCWVGGCNFIENINGWVYTNQADGYCPLIHRVKDES